MNPTCELKDLPEIKPVPLFNNDSPLTNKRKLATFPCSTST